MKNSSGGRRSAAHAPYPKKSLGQHFLHDANIARKIVRSLELKREERVVEIGPGRGALTRLMLGQLPHLTVIEIDNVLAAELAEAHAGQVTVLHEDVLTVNLPDLSRRLGGPVRVVGNIPYYITSQILFWIIDAGGCVSDATLMMQREVAERLVARPRTKAYGILSVFAQYYTRPGLLFRVAPSSFFPKPNVTSTVVRLECGIDRPAVASDDTMFRAVVRGAFGKRRKTLHNSLKSVGFDDDMLSGLGVDLERRPEELDVPAFVALANLLTARGATPGTAPPPEGSPLQRGRNSR